MKTCMVIDLGLVDYKEALDYQRQLFRGRHAGEIEDTIIFAQHFPVYTCGRSADPSSLIKGELAAGADLIKVDRGGSLTYHGPGQLMLYPIIRLPEQMDILTYIRCLEAVAQRALAVFGIKASHGESSGVWVGKKKIGSIGLKVSSQITMHGLALNANVDLKAFEPILACGLKNKATSMGDILGYEIDISDLIDLMILNFGKILNYKLRPERTIDEPLSTKS